MKFTLTRKVADQDYSNFREDDYYDNLYNTNELDATGDDFIGGSLHNAAPEAEAAAPAASSVSLKIVNPKSYNEASTIADLLLDGNTILLNIEGLSREHVVRLLDYLTGATRMVGAIMQRVGETSTIVIAPKSVDVSSLEAIVSTN